MRSKTIITMLLLIAVVTPMVAASPQGDEWYIQTAIDAARASHSETTIIEDWQFTYVGKLHNDYWDPVKWKYDRSKYYKVTAIGALFGYLNTGHAIFLAKTYNDPVFMNETDGDVEELFYGFHEADPYPDFSGSTVICVGGCSEMYWNGEGWRFNPCVFFRPANDHKVNYTMIVTVDGEVVLTQQIIVELGIKIVYPHEWIDPVFEFLPN